MRGAGKVFGEGAPAVPVAEGQGDGAENKGGGQRRGDGPVDSGETGSAPPCRVLRRRSAQNLARGGVGQRRVDGLLVGGVGAQQAAFANRINQPGDAAGMVIDDGKRTGLDHVFGQFSDPHPVADVIVGFRPCHGVQVIPCRDALAELAHVLAAQDVAQFRLADEDDLQQFGARRFQVGQQADLFQQAGGQVLRFVDDEHGAPALGMAFQEPLVERVHMVLDAARRTDAPVDGQLIAYGRQQFGFAEAGVQAHGEVDVVRQLFDQTAGHGGLSGADLTGQQDEAAGAIDAVLQMRERFLMALTQKEVAGIRRVGERIFFDAEVFPKHALAYSRPANRAAGLTDWRRKAGNPGLNYSCKEDSTTATPFKAGPANGAIGWPDAAGGRGP